mmetsp:Transcript_2705/g.4592  ORF Transcript_2705/g.4592 Transcript_2705/m.4592 type:complete len:150 (+) Transcript_2705:596-1045(+)
MNNQIRIWQLEDNPDPQTQPGKLKLKCMLENGPDSKDDILFVDWHPKGNALICGGKDFMIWLMNGATGDYLACFSGHEDEVTMAKFTQYNGGKQIVSSSADKTIRVWSPIKQDCLQVIKPRNQQVQFHQAAINCFALHHAQPLVISGDL